MAVNVMSPDPDRFFDGGSIDGTEPPTQTVPPRIVLRRVVEAEQKRLLWFSWDQRVERFRLERRIGYRARTDDGRDAVYLVPARVEFRTDLTSVPTLFTWLVPRSGIHLPAALVHDALVHDHEQDGGEADYLGPAVRRERADVIFRDAMGDVGTGLLRRWLMWTAVSLPTIWRGTGPTDRDRTYLKCAVFGTLALIGGLGIAATLDLFERLWSGWWVTPWGPDGTFWVEVGWGALMAVLIPVALASVFWRRYRTAGLIAGLALALLLHVSLALGLLTLLYLLLERAVKRREPEPETAPAT
jgi:hypothetical protein